MKLLALCSFLFIVLLCLNVFAAEDQKGRRICCSKALKLKKKAHRGTSFKITPLEKKKYCKPCPRPVPLVIPGPLPQLK